MQNEVCTGFFIRQMIYSYSAQMFTFYSQSCFSLRAWKMFCALRIRAQGYLRCYSNKPSSTQLRRRLAKPSI